MSVKELKARLASLPSRGGEIKGVALEPGDRWPAGRASGVTFTNCDFRMMQLGGVLSRPTFERCVFSHVRLDGGKWSRTSFRHCRFEDVDVGDAAMNHWSKCHFEDCYWSKGRLASANLDDCRIIDNSFEAISWECATLLRCHIEATTMSGRFRTVFFDHCLLEELDLSGVRFHELTFLDSEFKGDLRTPAAEDTVVFPNASDLEEWLGAVSDTLGPDTGARLNEDLRFIRKTGRPICIDLGSFDSLPLEQRAAVIEVGNRILKRA